MTKRLHYLIVAFKSHFLVSFRILLVSISLFSFTEEPKKPAHYSAAGPIARKPAIRPYDADPIKFTLEANKQTATVGEDVTLTITAHYLNIPPTLLFTADGSNGFRLKALLPDGFVQTGGDYVDYTGTTLSATTPTAVYKLIGHFEKPFNKAEFRLLRGSYFADANSLFVEKARLSILVTPADRSLAQKAHARSANCTYAEGQYLLNNGTEAMYAHYYNGILYAGYQDGSNFRPQHWLVATGKMTVEQASCFAESDPHTSPSNSPANPSPNTCSYSEGQYLFTFGTEAMYAHFYNGVLYAGYQDGNNFRPQHWLVATGLMTPTLASCFAENDPHTISVSTPTTPAPSTPSKTCGYSEGQYLLNNGTEAMYAHYYNGVLFAGYQDGSNFRPRHWLIATGQMTVEQAGCFTEDDPHTTSTPTPTTPVPSTPSGTCGYSQGQYLFTFGTEAMYAHYYNGVLYAAYQDGNNFRPQHWLVATGLMTPSVASCFAENDPHNGTPNPPSNQPSSNNCGTGNGLTGLYSNSLDLSKNLVAIRTDNQINFTWADSPIPGVVNADGFSIRWFGQIEAPVSGNYTFKTNNDDGTRLWVNGQQLIEDWNGHGPTWQQGSIYLTAGQKYTIILDYFDLWGGAQAQLYWEYPGHNLQLVPSCRLYSSNQTFSYDAPSPSDSRIPVCSINIGYVTYYTSCASGVVIDYTDNTPTSNPSVEDPTGTPGGTYGGIGRPKGGITSPVDPNIYYVPGGATNPVIPILQPVGTSAPSATQTALDNFYAAMRAKGIIFTYEEKAVIDEYPDILINRISTFVAQFGTMPDGRDAFILSIADQQRYPKFASLVRDIAYFVENDEKVKAALIQYTGYPYNKLKALLKDGQGPRIYLVDNLTDRYGQPVLGLCDCDIMDKPNESKIQIKENYAQGYELDNGSISRRRAGAFLLAVTVLHEFVHYGRNQNQLNDFSAEFGESFEVQAFGVRIGKDNAGKLSYRMFQTK